jgi:hypothetical protein
MVAIIVQYACLHSSLWCNPLISVHTMTYLVWWLLGCCWDVDRHAQLNLFFSFSSNIQFLFCQYHTYTRTWTKSRTIWETNSRIRRFLFLFLHYTSVYTYRHVPLCSSVRQRGEQMHLFPLSLSFSFFFVISRSFSNMIEWIVISNYDK